jgi:small-conductance mechanosensitive channel
MAMIKFALALLIGAIIYIFFSAARFFLMKSGRIKWKSASMVLISIEIIVWTVYFFWSVERIFNTKSYYGYLFTGLLLIGFAFLVWFYLKEVVAGAFFKLQHDPKVGRYLHVDQLEGVIKTLSATHVALNTADGDIIKIPFSKLITNVFSLTVQKDRARDFRFKFRIDKRWEKDEAITQIRNALILSPYCSFKDPIDIQLENENASSYAFDVSVRLISQEFEGSIEKTLKKRLGESQESVR